jgi:hypothetical protein
LQGKDCGPSSGISMDDSWLYRQYCLVHLGHDDPLIHQCTRGTLSAKKISCILLFNSRLSRPYVVESPAFTHHNHSLSVFCSRTLTKDGIYTQSPLICFLEANTWCSQILYGHIWTVSEPVWPQPYVSKTSQAKSSNDTTSLKSKRSSIPSRALMCWLVGRRLKLFWIQCILLETRMSKSSLNLPSTQYASVSKSNRLMTLNGF